MLGQLAHPPIVEAVVDFDCDMPPGLDIGTLQGPARAVFEDHYPKLATRVLQEHTIQTPPEGSPTLSVRKGFEAFQFLQSDERQLVQLRTGGYSFNRLAPYARLDDYLPEVRRTWSLFVGLVAPVQVREVKLRYINRILVPLLDGKVDLEEYLAIGPRLPEEESLTFAAFLHRDMLVEKVTGHRVNTTLASQKADDTRLALILDIEAAADVRADPGDWPSLLASIEALRALKNLVFERTLTVECLKLFS